MCWFRWISTCKSGPSLSKMAALRKKQKTISFWNIAHFFSLKKVGFVTWPTFACGKNAIYFFASKKHRKATPSKLGPSNMVHSCTLYKQNSIRRGGPCYLVSTFAAGKIWISSKNFFKLKRLVSQVRIFTLISKMWKYQNWAKYTYTTFACTDSYCNSTCT